MSYDRQWLEESGSEDSHGRAMWALGTVLGNTKDAGLRGAAGRLFEKAFPAVSTFTSPRAWAFSILGMQAYLDWFPGDRVVQGARNLLANRLLDIYERTHSQGWHWFETSLSYSNARLPQALLLAGWHGHNQRMVEVGCESLKWLAAEQHLDDKDIFVPIGSMGFFAEGGERSRFDQQPVEACASISLACSRIKSQASSHGLTRHGPHFAGFSAATISRYRFTTPPQGAAEMGSIPTASTRIRAQSRRSPS